MKVRTASGSTDDSLNRSALLAALADDPVDEMPAESSTDVDEWNLLVDVFADRVLWDADYELSDFHLDLPPTEGERMDDVMQVDDSYFAAVAADLHPTKVEAVVERLRKLIRFGQERQ